MRESKFSYLVFMSVLFTVNGGVNDNEVDDGKHSLELTQSVNLARQEYIQEKCRGISLKYSIDELPPSQLEHILVDEERKLLYCYVPKVACTNWKRVLMILAKKWNNTDVLSIPGNLAHVPGMFQNLSMFDKQERDYMLDNYNKMVIVRHPFERLLSAYRNKLEGVSSSKYFRERVGRRIIKLYRKNPSNESLEHGNDVTFKEFVLFLTDRASEMADVIDNEHWQPISNLCHPCLIKYTLVGKYETLLDDALLALRTINAPPSVQFPRLAHTSGTSEKLHKYFSQLDLPLIKRLYKLYKYDYRIFDYKVDGIIGFDLG